MKKARIRPGLFYFVPFVVWGTLTVLFLFFVFYHVDLKPRVDQNFFFSSNDPQLQADQLISKLFLQEPQLIVGARGDIHSPTYLRKVRALTDELSAIPEVDTVESLTRGPSDTDEALKSPLWKRVLFSEDQRASFIYVWLKQHASLEKGVQEIEKIKQRLDTPDFPLMMSGAPYLIELIQRNLLHDLKLFSIAAFCVFGLSGLAISRSIPMVLRTLIACTNASQGKTFRPIPCFTLIGLLVRQTMITFDQHVLEGGRYEEISSNDVCHGARCILSGGYRNSSGYGQNANGNR